LSRVSRIPISCGDVGGWLFSVGVCTHSHLLGLVSNFRKCPGLESVIILQPLGKSDESWGYSELELSSHRLLLIGAAVVCVFAVQITVAASLQSRQPGPRQEPVSAITSSGEAQALTLSLRSWLILCSVIVNTSTGSIGFAVDGAVQGEQPSTAGAFVWSADSLSCLACGLPCAQATALLSRFLRPNRSASVIKAVLTRVAWPCCTVSVLQLFLAVSMNYPSRATFLDFAPS
jgi:hypothetical protein